jgi:hypothetical protein
MLAGLDYDKHASKSFDRLHSQLKTKESWYGESYEMFSLNKSPLVVVDLSYDSPARKTVAARNQEKNKDPKENTKHQFATSRNIAAEQIMLSTVFMTMNHSLMSRYSSDEEFASAEQVSMMTPLPSNFSPCEYDVLVGRGKRCFNHIGNHRFRNLVNGYLDQYSSTKSKLEKSSILRRVVDEVRSRSPSGGFVKKDNTTNQWYEVGDFLAREKTSQCFRDALHERYRSSTKSKKKRRQNELAKASDRLNTIASSETNISSQIEELSSAVQKGGSESDMTDLFTRTNMEILKSLNKFSGQEGLASLAGLSASGIELLASSTLQQEQQEKQNAEKPKGIYKDPTDDYDYNTKNRQS